MSLVEDFGAMDITCQNLEVRSGLSVGGVPYEPLTHDGTLFGAGTIASPLSAVQAEDVPSGVFVPMQFTDVLFLASGADAQLADGSINGQSVACVLVESPAATVVIETSTGNYKTNGDGIPEHYGLTFYWSVSLNRWWATGVMQWDF